MIKRLRDLIGEQSAVTAIEYALLAGLIAVVILVAVGTAGSALASFYAYVSGCVSAAAGGAGAC